MKVDLDLAIKDNFQKDIGKPLNEDDSKYSEQGVIENHYLGGHLEK